MRAMNDPIPVLRRVISFINREDLVTAADCLLEGLRRVMVTECEWHGVDQPPASLDRHLRLVLMAKSLRVSGRAGMDDDDLAVTLDWIDTAVAAFNGLQRDPITIARAAFGLAGCCEKNPWCMPSDLGLYSLPGDGGDA